MQKSAAAIFCILYQTTKKGNIGHKRLHKVFRDGHSSPYFSLHWLFFSLSLFSLSSSLSSSWPYMACGIIGSRFLFFRPELLAKHFLVVPNKCTHPPESRKKSSRPKNRLSSHVPLSQHVKFIPT